MHSIGRTITPPSLSWRCAGGNSHALSIYVCRNLDVICYVVCVTHAAMTEAVGPPVCLSQCLGLPLAVSLCERS